MSSKPASIDILPVSLVKQTPCSQGASTASARVVDVDRPVVHTWSNLQKFRRKFCNVCRKRMDDRIGVRCLVCKYYAHKRCMPTSLPMCKRSADYNTFVTPDEHSQTQHQWMEGNLKASDKCAVCSQACSSDCLSSGQRCLWCLATVHSGCRSDLDRRCTAGLLNRLLLPPYSVYCPRLADREVEMTPVASECDLTGTAAQRLQASVGMQATSTAAAMLSTHGPQNSMQDLELDDESLCEQILDETMSQAPSRVVLKVFDSLLDDYKKVSVSADADAADILATALDAFNIAPGEAARFCVGVETAPRSYAAVTTVAAALVAGGDKVVLRVREPDEQTADAGEPRIRVYLSCNNEDIQFGEIAAPPATSAFELVDLAIEKFGLIIREWQRRDYAIVEVNMFDGLQERMLDDEERPWTIMRDYAGVSVQQLQMVRLYLRNVKMDVPCTFYVGDLPIGWDGGKMVESLRQAFGVELAASVRFGPTFPTLGCLLLFVDKEEESRQICHLLQTAIFIAMKHPTVYRVPTIQDEVIPDSSSPLLVFVNERSGGGQGAELLTQMIRLLNPYQVFNLSHGGPLPGLFAFRNLKSFRVLVAGGDGTVGWVLSQMDVMKKELRCPSAPVAVIPLGTGNDLARVLRWGAGFSGESAMSILEVMEDSLVVPLDRWHIAFSTGGAVPDATTAAREPLALAVEPVEGNQSFVMNNYLGIGVEAEIALKFHLAREENPEKFNSRLHNKGVYLKMSIGKMMQRGSSDSSRDLSKVMVLEVDKERVKIPSGVEGIIILNIKSWMAGCDGWGAEKDDKFKAPAMNDGLLEVIGVQGVMHLGQIQGGLRGGIRLAQGSDISFRISCPTPVEIDGEPFMQPASRCSVKKGQAVHMMRRYKRVYGNSPNFN